MKKELLDNTSLVPLLKPTVTPLSAGTSTTLWINRDNFLSAIMSVAVGDATGTPTTQSVTVTVQDATDSSGTGAANLKDIFGDDITVALTADDTNAFLNVDLAGARGFIGLSVVTAFTGGTTPAIPVNSYCALGDPKDTREI